MSQAIVKYAAPWSGQRRNFSVTVMFAIGAMIIAALIVAFAGIYWATHESDAVSVERQARSAQHAMEASVDELALQQETVAIWDESALRLIAERRDMSWIHDKYRPLAQPHLRP